MEKIAYFFDLVMMDFYELGCSDVPPKLGCSDGLPEIVHDDVPPKEALQVQTNLIFCYFP